MTAPDIERIAHLHLAAWEVALRTAARNGHPPHPDMAWILDRVALSNPQAAVRCGRVLAVLDPEVRDAVTRLAAEHTPPDLPDVTAPPGEAAPDADSAAGMWLAPSEAARVLGIGTPGVRAALRRGTLQGYRDKQGWHIEAASAQEYARRRHG
ncbi:MAG: helix-turn-helix domain-containing protein [Pseudonocardiaceae bacterium]